MQSRFAGEWYEEQVDTPEGGYEPGDIVQAPSGRAGFVAGQRPLDEGEPATIRTVGRSELASASATTFTAGDTVGWDDTDKLAVAGGAGDFNVGTAARDKANGETTVLVIFNEPVAAIADLQAQIDAL